MGFDVSALEGAADWYELTLGESTVRLGLRRPDHLELLNVEYESGDLIRALDDHRHKLKQWVDDFEARHGKAPAQEDMGEAPLFEVAGDAFVARVEFIVDHITAAEGLEQNGKAVEWDHLARPLKIRFIRFCGPQAIWGLYDRLVEMSSLGKSGASG